MLSGYITVREDHKGEEGLFDRIDLGEFAEEAQHNVQGGTVLRIPLLQQRRSRALEVLSVRIALIFLDVPARVVQGPGAISHHMEVVDDDFCVAGEGSGDIPEAAVHIHHRILDIVPVGEGFEMILNAIEYAARKCVGDDVPEPLAIDISLESIEGDGTREASWACTSGSRYAGNGGCGRGGDIFHATALA